MGCLFHPYRQLVGTAHSAENSASVLGEHFVWTHSHFLPREPAGVLGPHCDQHPGAAAPVEYAPRGIHPFFYWKNNCVLTISSLYLGGWFGRQGGTKSAWGVRGTWSVKRSLLLYIVFFLIICLHFLYLGVADSSKPPIFLGMVPWALIHALLQGMP